ncbi:MAG: hypothetical protein JW740_01660 [Candidatus Zambryskibacteria bacterium]|nr:hypothetical protein [Candidatus Zambryskibacteria bacterium]
MPEYKRLGAFGRGGGRGDGNFDRRGRRSNFGGGNRRDSGGRDSGRPQMFSTTCASCHKTCEVPFRPTGDKPVYCDDCFRKNRGISSGDYGQRNRKDKRDSFSSKSQVQDKRIDELKIQLDSVNAKLDKIIEIINMEAKQTSLEAAVKKIVAPKEKEEKKKPKKIKIKK